MTNGGDIGGEIRSILPKVAAALGEVNGVLVGGTALALQLRHRVSFDIDIQVLEDFNPQTLLDRLRSLVGALDVQHLDRSSLVATVDGVKVEMWRSRVRQTPIEDGPVVDGMRLASLPDLFALKLRAVTSRAQLRDYVDIAVLTERVMSMRDGIRAYAARFHLFLLYEDLADVLAALTVPPRNIPLDPMFEYAREDTLERVQAAAEDALGWLVGRNGTDRSAGDEPDAPRIPLP